MSATCVTCPFFDPKNFTCRASPPVVAVTVPGIHNVELPLTETVWPQVGPGDWCGKHPDRAR